MTGARVLYLSYDGMTDPLGASQVLPDLVGLAGRGHRITLVSCDKPDRLASGGAAIRAQCQAAGIEWQPLPYHKRPPLLSTLRDLAAMRRLAHRLHAADPFDLVHCRSYLPALIGMGMKRRDGTPYLFDMRGFWADERVEAGQWASGPSHLIYRWLKREEQRLLANADGIVSLTDAARSAMVDAPGGDALASRIAVIPCCVDTGLFDPRGGTARAAGRGLLGIGAAVPVMLYLGSLGGNYLLNEMIDQFAAWRATRPGAIMLFVTREPADPIRAAAAAHGIDSDALMIRAASRDEVPLLVAAADIGVAFKRASWSALACSPTKLGEMLAMGLPVIANRGVGDVELQLASSASGVTVDAFDRDNLDRALVELEALHVDPSRARDAAVSMFSLADGIARYDAVYRRLMAVSAARQRSR